MPPGQQCSVVEPLLLQLLAKYIVYIGVCLSTGAAVAPVFCSIAPLYLFLGRMFPVLSLVTGYHTSPAHNSSFPPSVYSTFLAKLFFLTEHFHNYLSWFWTKLSFSLTLSPITVLSSRLCLLNILCLLSYSCNCLLLFTLLLSSNSSSKYTSHLCLFNRDFSFKHRQLWLKKGNKDPHMLPRNREEGA